MKKYTIETTAANGREWIKTFNSTEDFFFMFHFILSIIKKGTLKIKVEEI